MTEDARIQELDRDIKNLTKAIDQSAVSYFINGKSKWTTGVLISVATLLIGQAILGGFYILVKAPTVEWVDQRISEKIQSAPITPEAQLRVSRNEQGLKEMNKQLGAVQETTIETKVHVQLLRNSVDNLTKELKMVGFGRGTR